MRWACAALCVAASVGPAGAAAETPSAEVAALRSLYDSTGGPRWADPSTWATPSTGPRWFTPAGAAGPCGGDGAPAWAGVECAASGSVTKINLRQGGLAGPGVSLAALPELDDLNLGLNGITGEIAAFELGGNARLTSVDVSFNRISGRVDEMFGDSVMPHLKWLYAGANPVGGTVPGDLLSRRLPALVSIGMDHSLVSGPLPSFAGAGSLTQAGFNDCRMTGTIPGDIGEAPLEALYVGGNTFEGELPFGRLPPGVRTLFASNANLSGTLDGVELLDKLAYLEIQDNLFSGSVAPLASLSSVVEVRAGGNRLDGALDDAFWSAGGLGSLQSLDVSRNNISGEVSGAVAPGLRFLGVSHNAAVRQLGPFDLGAGNLSLYAVDASHCDLQAVDVTVAQSAPLLSSLRLAGNAHLDGVAVQAFASAAGSLSVLDLTDCAVTWEAGSYYTMPALDTLLLGGNRLQYFGFGFVPATILSTLDLRRNPLEGQKIINLNAEDAPRLRELYLDSSGVGGSLSDPFQRLADLEVLSMRNTSMRYRLPGGQARPFTCFGAERMGTDRCVPTEFLAADRADVPSADGAPIVCTVPRARRPSVTLEGGDFRDYFFGENCACAAGTVGVPDPTGAGGCEKCCDGCVCPGGELGALVFPEAGRWMDVSFADDPAGGGLPMRASYTCLASQECRHPDACSHASAAGPPWDVGSWRLCADGYTGRLCAGCSGHNFRSGGSCASCPPPAVVAVSIAAAPIGVAALVAYAFLANPTGSALVTVIATHAQTAALLAALPSGGQNAGTYGSSFFVDAVAVVGSVVSVASPHTECVSVSLHSLRARYAVVASVLPLAALLVAVAGLLCRGRLAAAGGELDTRAESRLDRPLLPGAGGDGPGDDDSGSAADAGGAEPTRSQRVVRAALWPLHLLALPSLTWSLAVLRWERDACTGQAYHFHFQSERYSPALAAVAAVFGLVYLVGDPLALLWLLRHRARRLSPFAALGAFLSAPYSPPWWELALFARKAALAMAFALLDVRSGLLPLMAMLVELAALCAHLVCSPMSRAADRHLETASLATFVIAFAAAPNADKADGTVTVVVALAVFLVAAVGVFLLVRRALERVRRKR